jgi:tRNA (cmo5U34)-methyltransferase
MNKDTVVPGDKWEFNADVAKVFDDMLSRSIPSYDAMRDMCYKLGRNFTSQSKSIIDLGASRGESLRPFIEDDAASVFYGVEISEAMRNEMSKIYADNDKVRVLDLDLRRLVDSAVAYSRFNNDSSLILSILTLQFVPTEFRPQIMQFIYNQLVAGGAFIFVEKCISSSPELNKLFIKEYHNMKRDNGYSLQDIEAKRASLENVLVSVTEQFNIDMMRAAGFTKIECFYRHYNFVGWIAVK